jgi:hypothetical protein
MFAPLLVYQVAVIKNDPRSNQKWTLSVGKEPRQLFNSLIVPSFFLILIVVLSLRHELVGKDLLNYKVYFSYYSTVSLRVVLQEKQDILYWLLNWVISRFTDDYQVFLAVIACITVLPIAKLYSEDRQYGYLKIVLFMNMSVFIMLFSGLRQSVALAMGMIAYEYVVRKKPLRFLLFALIAFGFHHSAFIILLYYPLCHFTFKRRHLWFVIPAILAVFIFNKPIFSFAAQAMNSVFGEKYDGETTETGAYAMLILFAIFTVFAYVLPDEKLMDKETLGQRNLLLMALMLQCFAPVHVLAMRLNYYFIIFIPVLIPKILKYHKRSLKKLTIASQVVMIGFFVLYYLINTYESCKTGISDLNTYPYIPFWK